MYIMSNLAYHHFRWQDWHRSWTRFFWTWNNDFFLKETPKQNNNNKIVLLICFISNSIQATSRLCWFSLSFFASSPPRVFLKFIVCSLTRSFPIRILLLHSQNPLDVTPRCMAEILLTNIFSFLCLSPVFLLSLSLCACVSSPFWITLLLFTSTRWKNPLYTVTSSIFKNQRISKNTSRYCDSPLYRCSSEMFLSESVNSE